MTDLFLSTSQQPESHLPSRVAPAQDRSSTQSSIVALIIIGAIAVSVVSVVGYKQYQRYRFRQHIKTLERLWQQSRRKRLR